MSPPRGLLGRSALLLGMLGLLPEIRVAERQARHIEDLLQHLWLLAPDLATQEVRDSIEQDVRSRCETSGASVLGACSALQVLLDRWVAAGREHVVTHEGRTGVGEWVARLLLQGPGQYIAEVRQPLGTIYSHGGLPSITAAAEETIRMSRRLQADVARLLEPPMTAEQLVAQVRAEPDMSPEDRANRERWLEDLFGAKYLRMRDALEREAGRQAVEGSVVVGETESGDCSKLEEMTAQEFAARFRIADDLVKDLPPAEQRAKMEAWLEDVLAKRPGSVAVSGTDWHPEDAAERAAMWTEEAHRAADPSDVRPFLDPPPSGVADDLPTFHGRPLARRLPDGSITSTRPTLETDFERSSRMAFNTSADRAFERMRPMNRLRREVLYEPKLEPAAPRPDWPPRYSAKPKPAKPPKGPEVRAEQRQRKAARTARKSRRGFA